ncbi:MAG: nuclear transport factor 2 family protein [Nitrososphaerales archaeon]|jgi:predicted SnoaL-like aldol condensation-catalyzing enzyme
MSARVADGSRRRKKVVREFFGLVSQGRQKESLRFFAADCRQHNPYVKGGMEALFDAMAAAQQAAPNYPDPSFAVKKVIVDGNMVAAHTELLSSASKPGEGGLRQVHLFRFGRGDRIVEYWDITQTIQPEMPNPANAF